MKRSKKKERLEDWEKKVLHGQCLRQMKEVGSDQTWACLQNGDLKRKIERSIRTNLVKAKIDKSQGDVECVEK